MTYGDAIRGSGGLAAAACKSSFVLFGLVTVNGLDVRLLLLLHLAAAVVCLMVEHVLIRVLLFHAHSHIWWPTVEWLITLILTDFRDRFDSLLWPLDSVEDIARDVCKCSLFHYLHGASA